MRLAILVIYAFMGWLLASISHGWDTYEFWAMMFLMIALENATAINTRDMLFRSLMDAAEAMPNE